MRRGRAESSSTSRHRVVGPCVLPFLFISNIGFHILFLLFSIASTSSQAQHPHFSPLSTPPRSVILSASAGHRLLACLHSQNQSTRHTTGWICSLRRLSLPGWPSREDLPIGPRPVLSIFHLVIEPLSQMHLIQKSNIYQTEDRVAMLVKCGLG